MMRPYRFLHVDDNEQDVSEVQSLLASRGIECLTDRVASHEEFVTALEGEAYDLVMAELCLESFAGMTALKLAKQRAPLLPFIFVTAASGEEPAITALREGATDYVLKSRLSGIVSAVSRALHEAEEARERLREERELRRSEANYRTLFENSIDGVLLTTIDGRILAANHEAQRIFGRSDEEICRAGWGDIVDAADARLPLFVAERDRTGRSRGELLLVREDGTRFPGEVSCGIFRDSDGFYKASIVVRDITDRKAAEEELRRSNELSRAIIEASPLALITLDIEGTVLMWNPAAERIFGWAAEEALGTFLPIIEEEKAEVFHWLRDRVRGGEPLAGMQLRRRHRDGTPLVISVYAAPIYDDKGEVSAIMAMVADITEQRQVEKDLLQSEQRFRAAFEDAVIGMCLAGTDGRFLAVNRALCEMIGYGAAELGAMKFHDVVFTEDSEQSLAWSEGMLRGEACPSGMEARFLHRDGRIVWGHVSKFLLRDNRGVPLYFINQIQDITERKNLESQLRHSQKMEAIGTLTGGIAHDFNNILTAIIGYGSLIEMRLDEVDPLRPFVEHILTAAERAAGLTQSLLAFGRKQSIETRLVDLNDVVRGVEKFLLRLVREDIDLRATAGDDAYTVMADVGQLEQVLMNMATNARDAMPDGGVLAIGTSRTIVDRDFTSAHGYGKPGHYALITVSDTGSGMDDGTRLRIFEPFFTTKEVGKGTGLGLSVAYGIIKSHNGYITCYSEPGQGTTFRIYLPLVNASVEPQETLPAFAIPVGGCETILLAEDEPQVRALTRELLERFGYRVIEAVDGRDALERFAAHRSEIHLALLDVIMPGRNGRDVYHEMLRAVPDLKVVFTSGYSADIFQRGEGADAGLPFISKPVVPTELLKLIRQVLDR